MTAFVRCLAIVVLVTAATCLASSGPASADIGTFPGGTSASVVRDGATRAVFPIQLRKGIRAKAVTPVLMSALRDGLPEAALEDSITVRWRPAFPAVVVRLNDAKPAVGSYTVSVRLRTPKRSQIVAFTLKRETAKVTLPSTVTVVQVQKVTGLGILSWLDSPSEPSLVARIGAHDAVSRFGFTENDAAGPGSISVRDNSVVVKKGDTSVPFDYQFKDLPLGASTRTVEIDAPELAEPRTVTFNVTTKRPLGLLPLTIALGLGLGWLVRRWLDPSLGLLLALRERERLLEDLQHEIDQNSDATYLDEVNAALTIAATPRAFALARTQTTAVTKATSRWVTAQTDLGKRLRAARDDLSGQAALMDRGWPLPPGLADRLTAIRGQFEKARACLARRDADGTVKVNAEIRDAAARFTVSATAEVVACTNDASMIRDCYPKAVTGDSGRLTSTLAFLWQRPAERDLEAVLQDLATLQEAQPEILRCATNILGSARDAVAVFPWAEPPGILAGINAAEQQLRLANTPAAVIAITAAASTMVRQWVQSLADTAPVRDRLDRGEVREAIAAAVRPLLALESIEATSIAQVEAGTDGLPPPSRTLASPNAPGAEAPVQALVTGPHRQPPRLFVSAAIGGLSLLRFVILLVALTFVGFVLFQSDWTGSVQQIALAVSWSFTTDVTTASLAKAFKAPGYPGAKIVAG